MLCNVYVSEFLLSSKEPFIERRKEQKHVSLSQHPYLVKPLQKYVYYKKKETTFLWP